MRKIIFVFVTVLLSILFLVYFLYYDQMVNQITNEQSLQIEEIKEAKVCEVEKDMKEKIQEPEIKPEIKPEIEPEIKPEIKPEPQINPNEYMIFEATAYTRSAEEETLDGITASGTIVSRGTVSVDPRVIPLGTKLYVEGYGHAYALDTGGAIKGNRIDLYVETKKEAFEWGRRQVKVWILK